MKFKISIKKWKCEANGSGELSLRVSHISAVKFPKDNYAKITQIQIWENTASLFLMWLYQQSFHIFLCQSSFELKEGYEIHYTIISHWQNDTTNYGLSSGGDLSCCAWLCAETG